MLDDRAQHNTQHTESLQRAKQATMQHFPQEQVWFVFSLKCEFWDGACHHIYLLACQKNMCVSIQ